MSTITHNLKLYVPAFDQIPWDYEVNSNWQVLDAAVGMFTSIPNITGIWKNATAYTAGQSTIDITDSSVWVCAITHTSPAAPTTFAADRAGNPGRWVLSTTGGLYLPISGGTITGNLDVVGSLSVHGTLSTTGNIVGAYVQATTAVQASADGQFQMYQPIPSIRRFAFDNDWFWDFNITTGDLVWNAFSVGTFIEFTVHATPAPFYRGINWMGPWQGNGAYIDTSDERLKTHTEPTTVGLAQVLGIKPIQFRRLNQERTEIGFSAQQLAPILPEAVVHIGTPTKTGPGALTSSEPMLGITSETIIAALVNGMKEIASRLDALENK